MLRLACLEEAPQLATVKNGFAAPEVIARLQALATGNFIWPVWWVDNQPRGWALVHWEGKPTATEYPDISDLYVHPDWRGRGIGTRILLGCEAFVRAAGHTRVGLAVNPQLNPRAYTLYKRLGYSAVSQEPYLDGVYNGVEDWVIDLVKQI